MWKRAMLYLVAVSLSLVGVCLTGGCELPRDVICDDVDISKVDTSDLIGELIGREFEDLDGLFGDDD